MNFRPLKIYPSTEWPMALSYNRVKYSEKYLPSLADRFKNVAKKKLHNSFLFNIWQFFEEKNTSIKVRSFWRHSSDISKHNFVRIEFVDFKFLSRNLSFYFMCIKTLNWTHTVDDGNFSFSSDKLKIWLPYQMSAMLESLKKNIWNILAYWSIKKFATSKGKRECDVHSEEGKYLKKFA